MIHDIFQIVVAQALFLITYECLLKKETFFAINRIYLLGTYCMSIAIPFLDIAELAHQIPDNMVINLPPVLMSGHPARTPEVLDTVYIGSQFGIVFPSLTMVLLTAWVSGFIITSGLLLIKFVQLNKLKRAGTISNWRDCSLVTLPHSSKAFSFNRTIYLGADLPPHMRENICIHEYAHIKGRHSLDLILLELSKVIFWFNPMAYRYQSQIEELHEYIADAQTAQQITSKSYFQNLLSQAFQTENISFVNTFFKKSLIKKRIVMLQKTKSKKNAQLKYLMLLPLLSIIMLYGSCTQESTAQSTLAEGDSPIIQKIEEIKEEIAKTGNLSERDEKALKGLLLLVSEDGFSNPMFDDVIPDAKIPFGVIEKVPVYPGCENLSNEKTKECFIAKITELVGKEFNTKIAKDYKLSGTQKVYAHFTIANDGRVINVNAKSDKEVLKAEAIRVVNKLPIMQAGEQAGKKVNVEYTLPIIFEVD